MLIKGCDDNCATQLDDYGHKSSIQPTVNCFKQTLIGEKFLTDSHLERDKSHTYAHDVVKKVKLDILTFCVICIYYSLVSTPMNYKKANNRLVLGRQNITLGIYLEGRMMWMGIHSHNAPPIINIFTGTTKGDA